MSGKVLRIAHSEIVNSEIRGGLGLLEIGAMCDSLLVSQLFRLMKSVDTKSQKHLNFWMADYLDGIWDGLSCFVTVKNGNSHHFNSVADCLTKARMQEDFDFANWNKLTNKQVYKCFAKSFKKPKVERESTSDMTLVWRRLTFLAYTRQIHEVSFLMIHNKLPVQERLFRIQLSKDPYCLMCSGAEIQDIPHVFISCDKVLTYWGWTRDLCLSLLGNMNVDEESILKFHWPRSCKDREICWLIGHYAFIVWDMLFRRKLSEVNEKEFFGFLKFKYKEALAANIVSGIAGLL